MKYGYVIYEETFCGSGDYISYNCGYNTKKDAQDACDKAYERVLADGVMHDPDYLFPEVVTEDEYNNLIF